MKSLQRFSLALHAGLVLCLVAAGFAQSVARLDGTVTDSSQAVIAGCEVVLTNPETGRP